MEKGWRKHVDAFPGMRYLRNFSSCVITAPGLETGRLPGLEQAGLSTLAANFIKRLRALFYAAT